MSNSREATPVDGSPATSRREPVILILIGVVLGVYAWIASSNPGMNGATKPGDAYYNLLVQGFSAGQLHLKTPVPLGLTQLADPYDPAANEVFRATLHDTSYYREKIYIYFGVTPALLLFWPFAILTGSYLSHAQATLVFCAVGFLAATALLLAIRRRYYPAAAPFAVAMAVLAAGLATAVPVMLGRAEVWEVPIACAFACVMLALGALWRALHDAVHPGRWLAAASISYGLAVGARPSLLLGAVILLVPLVPAWRASNNVERPRRIELLRLLAAAIAPIAVIGLGLMLYNHARFGSPVEFGQNYQLAGVAVAKQRLLSADYIPFNLRVYFLQPLRWSGEFPFAQGIKIPPLPRGHLGVDGAFGALVNMPFLWLAGAALLVWRSGTINDDRRPLRGFIVAVALFFVACAGTLSLFAGACDRYQAEFLPALALLAGLGLFEWDRRGSSRVALHLAAGALLVFSATCNYLGSYKSGPQAQTVAGNNFATAGQIPAAIREYERALRTEPDFAYAHHGLALALAGTGRLPEAIDHYRQAVRSKPDFPEAFNALGAALIELRQPAEAEQAFAEALRLSPDFVEAHFGRAVALLDLNRGREAIPHLETALRLKPNFQRAQRLLDFVRSINPVR